jgi:crotonobetainyl-CoA:carnitine CoA-transferase CaiB-like acyl-CoA transferase
MLAEWGADVIKVDSPTRPRSPFSWIDVNRSKRSVLIDLTSSEGKEVCSDLIRSADVVLENFRAGKLDALGFDYLTVSALKPGIIYASMNAFDYPGPMERHPGWEHNAEALSGMQVARALNGRPTQVPYPVNDYMTGLLGAFGVLLALYQRDRTGTGALVSGSLSRSATFTQLASFSSQALRAAATLPTTRCVPCRDGTIVMDDADHRDSPAVQTVRNEAIDLPASDVLRRLEALGVPCILSLDIEALFRNANLSPFTKEWSQDSVGPVLQAFTPHYGDHEGLGLPRHPAPDPGSDTVSVLRSLGYDDVRIDSLLENGVLASSQPLFAREP